MGSKYGILTEIIVSVFMYIRMYMDNIHFKLESNVLYIQTGTTDVAVSDLR